MGERGAKVGTSMVGSYMIILPFLVISNIDISGDHPRPIKLAAARIVG